MIVKGETMISNITISNFKSVASAEFPVARVNIFVGEPNTGKSNILEALSLFSFSYYHKHGYEARSFVRFQHPRNLFYNEVLDYPLQIQVDDLQLALEFRGGLLAGHCKLGEEQLVTFSGDRDGLRVHQSADPERLAAFKSYRFQPGVSLKRKETGTLLPPVGDNLASLIISSAKLRSVAEQLLSPFRLHLFLRPLENIEIIRYEQDVVVALPYELLSDTLQRVIFYAAAILHNSDSIIILEEPEAYTFPYYTKYLAELVALDDQNNQFFISTHNPYFLMPILAKTPLDELAVFVTYTRDFETKIRRLRPDEMEQAEAIDIFGNMERFTEEDV